MNDERRWSICLNTLEIIHPHMQSSQTHKQQQLRGEWNSCSKYAVDTAELKHRRPICVITNACEMCKHLFIFNVCVHVGIFMEGVRGQYEPVCVCVCVFECFASQHSCHSDLGKRSGEWKHWTHGVDLKRDRSSKSILIPSLVILW